MNKIINTNNNKDNNKKNGSTILLLIIVISLFITATYAWFTDSAFSRGNKIFAGNLYVDVIATEDELIERYNILYPDFAIASSTVRNDKGTYDNIDNFALEQGYKLYQRKFNDGTIENYYIVTDKDASIINLYNMEPGQVRSLRINYLNTGDLAFKAAGALKIDLDEDNNKKSYTGLETLIQQHNGETETYKNEYAVGNGAESSETVNVLCLNSGGITVDDNRINFNILFLNVNGNNITYGEFKDYPIYDIEIVSTTNTNHLDRIYELIEEYKGKTLLSFNNYQAPDNCASQFKNIFNSYIAALSADGDNGNMSSVLHEDQKTITNPSSNVIDPYYIHEDKDVNGNDYPYYSLTNEMSEEEYNRRLNKLLNHQAELDIYGNPKDYSQASKLNDSGLNEPIAPNYIEIGDKKYNNLGGHLEDVLEVYIIPKKTSIRPQEKEINPADVVVTEEEAFKANVVQNNTIDKLAPSSFNTDWLSPDSKYHDLYFFGNITQFTFLVENGPSATKDYELPLGRMIQDIIDDIDNGETVDAEQQYMALYNDASKSLYDDYQRYLACAGGYTLPKDALKNGDIIAKDVTVNVYDPEGNDTYIANEIGYTDLLLYMPTTVDSRYQNASISLSLGVTATQVEYEMDDLGIMIYDKYKPEQKPQEEDPGDIDTDIEKGDVISVEGSSEDLLFKILDVNENKATCLYLPNETGAFASEGTNPSSFAGGSQDLGILYKDSLYENAINSYLDTIENNNESFFNSIVKSNYSQYLYQYVNDTELMDLFNFTSDASSIYFNYNFRDTLINRHMLFKAKTSQSEVLARPLSLIDVVNYTGKGSLNDPIASDDIEQFLDGFGLDLNSKIDIWLSDAEYYYDEDNNPPYSINEQDYLFYITNTSNKKSKLAAPSVAIGDLYFDSSEYSNAHSYAMVFDFDLSKFSNYETVDIDSPVDDGIVNIGVVSNSSISNYCAEFISSIIDENNYDNYHVEDVRFPLNRLKGQSDSDLQYQKITELVNNNNIDYLIVEVAGPNHISDILSLANTKNIGLYFVGLKDTGDNIFKAGDKKIAYLADKYDYESAIVEILCDQLFEPEDIKSSIVYNSIYSSYTAYVCQNFDPDYEDSYFVNSYSNVYCESFSNYSSVDAIKPDVNLYISNYLLALDDLYQDLCSNDIDKPFFIFLCDNFYNTEAEVPGYYYDCYGLYYNYPYVSSRIFDDILSIENGGRILPSVKQPLILNNFHPYDPSLE